MNLEIFYSRETDWPAYLCDWQGKERREVIQHTGTAGGVCSSCCLAALAPSMECLELAEHTWGPGMERNASIIKL